LLRDVLADVDAGAHNTAEVRYVRDVERAHGLPVATRQRSAGGGSRVHDNVYEEYGLVVEVDGRLKHGGWDKRVRDGRRDRRALLSTGVTIRVFWGDVCGLRCHTAVEVGQILGARGWAGRPHPCRSSRCAVSEERRTG
jgi:very-short-patch-repair endonuclease